MFAPDLATEEDFTIADNYFERNTARNGGGILMGAFFQQTDREQYLNKRILKESVIFQRNTFVQNTADYGGAMLLGPGE